MSEDEDSWSVGLCDQPRDVKHYFIVQRSKHSDEPDRDLGSQGLYFEFDDQSRSFYDGVRNIQLSRGQLDISLTDAVAQGCALPSRIQIGLSLDETEWQRLKAGLHAIASNEPEGWLRL